MARTQLLWQVYGQRHTIDRQKTISQWIEQCFKLNLMIWQLNTSLLTFHLTRIVIAQDIVLPMARKCFASSCWCCRPDQATWQ